jgi:hypothetical protein
MPEAVVTAIKNRQRSRFEKLNRKLWKHRSEAGRNQANGSLPRKHGEDVASCIHMLNGYLNQVLRFEMP